MKKSLAMLVFMFLAACGGGGGSVVQPPPPPPPTVSDVDQFTMDIEGLTLTDFYQVSFGGILKRTPETVVKLALESVYPMPAALIDDWSEAYRADTWTIYQLAIDKLLTYDRAALSDAGKLNYDVYQWYLQDNLDEQEFELYSFISTYGNFGVPGNTERFFDELHPLATAQDVQDFLDRLSAFGTKFSQIETHLQRQLAAGIVEPALTMQVAINQINNLLNITAVDQPINQYFRDSIGTIPGLSTGQAANFRDLALNSVRTDVIPGYQRLVNTLQNLMANAPANIGVGQYPRGDEYYAYMLRHRTTTNLTPAEIHQLGLDELARIHAEMRVIFDQLGYPPYIWDDPTGETLEELYARVDAPGAGGIILAADSFATFESLVDFAEANLTQAFDVFPVAGVVVLPDPFGGFYIGPSFDGARPGAFYAGTDFDQPFSTMPTLTFHESLPGHHTQVAIQGESNLPLFRKLVRATAFTEGWALYAERLAFELGWYNGVNGDVYGNLGRLKFEALRAARLVMDTGIHSLGWDFQRAVDFNVDNVGIGEQEGSQGAAARYSVWPAQATAYMVGMLQILSERERAMTALGANFSLIDFHRAVLTNGAVPMSLLPTVVDAYIAANTP
jgi:uncharacterized protein (DUF885 family)